MLRVLKKRQGWQEFFEIIAPLRPIRFHDGLERLADAAWSDVVYREVIEGIGNSGNVMLLFPGLYNLTQFALVESLEGLRSPGVRVASVRSCRSWAN